jgi:hypothetical protein
MTVDEEVATAVVNGNDPLLFSTGLIAPEQLHNFMYISNGHNLEMATYLARHYTRENRRTLICLQIYFTVGTIIKWTDTARKINILPSCVNITSAV